MLDFEIAGEQVGLGIALPRIKAVGCKHWVSTKCFQKKLLTVCYSITCNTIS